MSEIPHSRRVLRNILYGFSTWIVPLFLGLLVTRVVVNSLGHNDYGVYALVLGFIAYSFNFNIGRAITKYLASYHAAGEKDKVSAIVSATSLITLVIASVGLVLTLGLSSILVTDVIKIELEAQGKAIEALHVAGVTIFALVMGQIPYAILQGLHRFDIYAKVQNVNSVVLMLGNLLLAYYGYGLIALLYWSLSATTLSAVIAFVIARRLLEDSPFGFGFGRKELELVLRFSGGVVGFQIASNIFLLFERGWLVSYLGTEALTFYVVPMTVGIYLHGFTASLTMSFFPLASEMDQHRERLVTLYQSATKAVLLVVVIIGTSLIVEGRLFLTLWMGPEFGERSALLLTMHTIGFGVAAICIVSFQTAEALGHAGFNSRNMAIGVVIGSILMIVLTERFASIGVAYGRIAVFVTLFVAVFDLERRYLGGVKWQFWSGALIRFGGAALAAAMMEIVLLRSLIPSWSALLIASAAGSAVYLMVLYFSGLLTDRERAIALRIVGIAR